MYVLQHGGTLGQGGSHGWEGGALFLKLIQHIIRAARHCLQEKTACSEHAALLVEVDRKAEHGGGLFALVVVEGQVLGKVSVLHHGLSRERGAVAFQQLRDAHEARTVQERDVLAFDGFVQRDRVVLDKTADCAAGPGFDVDAADGPSAFQIQLNAVVAFHGGCHQTCCNVGLTEYVGLKQAEVEIAPHLVHHCGSAQACETDLAISEQYYLPAIFRKPVEVFEELLVFDFLFKHVELRLV